jgi:prophage antirepressor-like protein
MADDIIQVFNNGIGGKLRVIEDENKEIWFAAKDVAEALEYSSAKDMTRILDDDEKGGHAMPTPGGYQSLSVINEAGVFHAINLRRSGSIKNKDVQANIKKFQHRVNHEILPSVRKSGSYTAQEEDDRITMARGLIAADQIVKELKATNSNLVAENAKLLPKAQYYDDVMDSDGLLSIRDSAKLMKSHDKTISEYVLRSKLRSDHIIEQRTRKATAVGIQRGYMKERLFAITHKDGHRSVDHYGCLTPKGLDWCIRRYTHQEVIA